MISVVSFGQSLEVLDFSGNVISGSTVDIWGDTAKDNVMSAQFNVKNKSASNLSVKVNRVEKSVISGSENYYCWDVCTNPSPDISNAQLIAAGASKGLSPLIADYDPKNKLGVSTIMYVFFVSNNPSDSTYIIVKFSATPTGMADNLLVGDNTISNAFPNPSNATVSLSYIMKGGTQKGKILVYNMLGSVVKEIELTDQQAVLTIPTSQLNSGLYFYTFMADEKIVSTKKLIVAH